MTQITHAALVADIQPMSRAGLAAMLSGELGLPQVLETGDFARALVSVACCSPQVGLIAVDLDLPGMFGCQGLRKLRTEHPEILVVVLAARRDRDLVLNALCAGVHGYIPKDMPRDDIRAAFRSVLSGQIYVPPLVSDVSAASPERVDSGGTPPDPVLTDRQRDVLRLLVAGRSNKEIARALRIAEGTVKVHMTAAFRILGVHNRVGAAEALRRLQASGQLEPADSAPKAREEQARPGGGAQHLRVITG